MNAEEKQKILDAFNEAMLLEWPCEPEDLYRYLQNILNQQEEE